MSLRRALSAVVENRLEPAFRGTAAAATVSLGERFLQLARAVSLLAASQTPQARLAAPAQPARQRGPAVALRLRRPQFRGARSRIAVLGFWEVAWPGALRARRGVDRALL